MDLQNNLPLTLLAVVAVLAVVSMVFLYNTETTGSVVAWGRAIATGKEPYKVTAYGQAIAAMVPRKACQIFGVTGDLFSLGDVPTYITAAKFNDLSQCYPFFSIEAKNTDQVCCRRT